MKRQILLRLRILPLVVLFLLLIGSFPSIPSAEESGLDLRVSSVTSSTVELRWNALPGAQSITVSMGSEPGPVLASQTEVARLSSSATTLRITKLAPDVNVFIRVDVETSGSTASAIAHVRTKGGPRAALDNIVREVRGYAPNILMVVLADNGIRYDLNPVNHGAAWQAGPWKVIRRNGTALPVTAVYRQSVPVEAPGYITDPMNYTGSGSNLLNTDHRMFLVFASAIGTTEMLRITGPAGVDFTLPFSDRYLETDAIQLNQVGYNPRATRRYAYVSGWMGDGGVLNLGNFPATAEVLSGPYAGTQPRSHVAALPVTPRSASDADSGGPVHEIDLAGIPAAEGLRYYLRLPGVGVSWPTMISEQAVFKAYYTILRGLFLNRWAGDLRPETTEWSRPQDHTSVYTAERTDILTMFPQTTPQNGLRPLLGGYHDAGDFDQRPMHTIVPQLLMRAFEQNPDAFTDGQLTIPESANGIPDLLDEAFWGVRGWEYLQESDGGVRAGVESYRHPTGIYYADRDPLPYWTYSRDPHTTARAAGLFAQAARLITPYDSARAAQLRDRAVRAYGWATNPSHRANNPPLLYAAGELFFLTGDPAYRTDFDNLWNAGANKSYSLTHLGFGDWNRSMSSFIAGYARAPGATASIASAIKSLIAQTANSRMDIVNTKHAHRNARTPTYSWWWGEGTAQGRNVDNIIARLLLGGLSDADRQKHFDALSLAADFVLGANPAGMVWFTGLGSRYPQEALHLDSLSFIRDGQGQIPGIPVYGPTGDISNASYSVASRAQFYPSPLQFPPARRYGDVRLLVPNNEFTVWECQAPHASHFAALLQQTGMLAPDEYLPGGSEHRMTIPGDGTQQSEPPPVPENAAPVVYAGPDQTVTLPNPVSLAGEVRDDGLPKPPGLVTWHWSQAEGPGTAVFQPASALSTSATFPAAGTYVLRLSATDGALTAHDDVVITVNAAAPPPPPQGVPNAPANLEASRISSSQIKLMWKDNASDEKGFKIYRSTDGVNFSFMAWGAPNATSCYDNGASSIQTYYYKVLAWNSTGESAFSNVASSSATATPPPPATEPPQDVPNAPSNLSAVARSKSQIKLTWKDNASNESGFKVYRSTDAKNFAFLAWGAPNATNCYDSGVSPGRTYYYKVLAWNNSGNSAYSNTASARTN